MRKSTLIISTILTVALLFALYSLLSAYRNAVETAVPATESASVTSLPADSSQAGAAEIQIAGKITIYDAAVTAAKVLGHNDVYITEYAQLNGVDVFLVTFLSGDLVYVNLDGQVISTSKQDPIDPYQPTSHK